MTKVELEALLQDESAFALESHFNFLADTTEPEFAAKGRRRSSTSTWTLSDAAAACRVAKRTML